jgi:hypothetical protein
MLNLIANTWIDFSFFIIQTYLNLQIFILNLFFDFILKLSKLNNPVFGDLPNLINRPLLPRPLRSPLPCEATSESLTAASAAAGRRPRDLEQPRAAARDDLQLGLPAIAEQRGRVPGQCDRAQDGATAWSLASRRGSANRVIKWVVVRHRLVHQQIPSITKARTFTGTSTRVRAPPVSQSTVKTARHERWRERRPVSVVSFYQLVTDHVSDFSSRILDNYLQLASRLVAHIQYLIMLILTCIP